MEQGTYELYLPKEDAVIQVVVHSGEYWDGDNFILRKDALIEAHQKDDLPKILKIASKLNAQDDTATYQVDVDNARETTRLHAVAF